MLLRKATKGEDDRLRAGAQSTEFGYIVMAVFGAVEGCIAGWRESSENGSKCRGRLWKTFKAAIIEDLRREVP